MVEGAMIVKAMFLCALVIGALTVLLGAIAQRLSGR